MNNDGGRQVAATDSPGDACASALGGEMGSGAGCGRVLAEGFGPRFMAAPACYRLRWGMRRLGTPSDYVPLLPSVQGTAYRKRVAAASVDAGFSATAARAGA